MITCVGYLFWGPVLEFSTFWGETGDGTIHVHASCTRPFRFIPVLFGLKGVNGGKVMSISPPPVFATLKYGAPVLEFSTLLDATEAIAIYIHASCLWPTRCTPVLLGFQGDKES